MNAFLLRYILHACVQLGQSRQGVLTHRLCGVHGVQEHCQNVNHRLWI